MKLSEQPNIDRTAWNNIMANDFIPYILHRTKEHIETIDYENPRDYLDILVKLAAENDNIGIRSIAGNIVGLYLGGSDTVANSGEFHQ